MIGRQVQTPDGPGCVEAFVEQGEWGRDLGAAWIVRLDDGRRRAYMQRFLSVIRTSSLEGANT